MVSYRDSHIDLLKHLTGKMVFPITLSLRGVLQAGIIFSKKTLAIEEAVACLQGKASVQLRTHPAMTKTRLYPRDGAYCMKTSCQHSAGPLGSSKRLGAV